MLTEADSHLGITNRLLAQRARRVYLAFPIEGRDGDRYEVVGPAGPAGHGHAPIAPRRAPASGSPTDERCLLVFGGSLGAPRDQRGVGRGVRRARPPSTCCTPSGQRDHPTLAARLEELGAPPHYHLEPTSSRSRTRWRRPTSPWPASGGSVFELAAAGLPAILVPYPHATADHQTGNARWMADAGRRGGRARTPSSTPSGWRAR